MSKILSASLILVLISYSEGLSATSSSSAIKRVESLSELDKKTFFCLRIPQGEVEKSVEEDTDEFLLGKGACACVAECQRVDKNPLGWGLPGSEEDDETCVRRTFAFTAGSSNMGKPYVGPYLVHCRQLPFSYGKLGGTVWYAAVALAQYIALHPSLVEGKSILELGAG